MARGCAAEIDSLSTFRLEHKMVRRNSRVNWQRRTTGDSLRAVNGGLRGAADQIGPKNNVKWLQAGAGDMRNSRFYDEISSSFRRPFRLRAEP